MKHLKYSLFLLISLVLAVQAFAQPDTRRMNISIGIFSPSATAYDYEGAIGVVGSTGYTVDDIQPGDMFWDDASRYRVDSIEVIVAGTSATVWVTDLYGAGAPQSGKGTLGKPSPNLGLQPLTENGSNFITEAQEAKIMTDNLQRMDSLAGDGNGIVGMLRENTVWADTSGGYNDFGLFDLTYLALEKEHSWLQFNGDNIELLYANPAMPYDNASTLLLSNSYALISNFTETSSAQIGIENGVPYVAGGAFPSNFIYYLPMGPPGANQVLGEGATDDNVLEWVDLPDLPAGDGNGIFDGGGTLPGEITLTMPLGTGAVMEKYEFYDGTEAKYTRGFSGFTVNTHTAANTYPATFRLSRARGNGDEFANWLPILEDDILGRVVFAGFSSFGSDDAITISGIAKEDFDAVHNKATLQIDDADDVKLSMYGSGNKEDSDLTKTESTYAAIFATDGTILEKPISEISDGNGIISALPAGHVAIDANNNALIIDSTSTTRIGAIGSAKGDLVVSGNTSLPSSLSHIAGADTSQINVQHSGIDIKATTGINVIADTISFQEASLLMAYDGSGDFNLSTGRTLEDAANNSLEYRGFFDSPNYFGSLGIMYQDDGSIGSRYIELTTSGVNIASNSSTAGRYGSIGVASTGTLTLAGYTGSSNGASIALSGNGGVRFFGNGTGYSYYFPESNPTSTDSLDRAMVWRQGASSFKVVNDGDYRTINATGNILPYDDIVEVIQGITVHLPAPSPTYQGKIYTIIAGGTVSGANPSNIDVVDGSSTIELGASLTLDNAFEVYTLTCNGSQWIVLNNKP